MKHKFFWGGGSVIVVFVGPLAEPQPPAPHLAHLRYPSCATPGLLEVDPPLVVTLVAVAAATIYHAMQCR